MVVNTAFVGRSRTVYCTSVGEQIDAHAAPSLPTLGEPQGFELVRNANVTNINNTRLPSHPAMGKPRGVN